MDDGGAPRRVLITGAGGRIGTGFARWVQGRYDLTLLDLPGRLPAEHEELGTLVEADLQDLPALRAAASGIDTIVHLGGVPSPSAVWSELLPHNIIGTYHTVAAALSAGCRRMVFASTVHTVMGQPEGVQVRESDPARPGDLYGVSKCFGEALGSYAWDAEGLSFVALRIGAFQETSKLAEPDAGWMLRDYCEPSDLFRLIETVIEDPDLGFEIFHAAGRNTINRMSVDKARRVLGYVPHADSTQLVPPLRQALDSLGGLRNEAAESGMREDVQRRD